MTAGLPSAHKPLEWIGSSRKDLREFPEDVQDLIGYALFLAQAGGKHEDAKPLKGSMAFRGAGVLEVVDDYDGDTYRAVYTVQFAGGRLTRSTRSSGASKQRRSTTRPAIGRKRADPCFRAGRQEFDTEIHGFRESYHD
jgi:phage-related protein